MYILGPELGLEWDVRLREPRDKLLYRSAPCQGGQDTEVPGSRVRSAKGGVSLRCLYAMLVQQSLNNDFSNIKSQCAFSPPVPLL